MNVLIYSMNFSLLLSCIVLSNVVDICCIYNTTEEDCSCQFFR